MEQGRPSTLNESLEAISAALKSETHVASAGLSNIFPKRTRMPWPESPPHPLLQSTSTVSTMSEFNTIFHDKLMELYSNHVIQGQTIFPGAGYIEMGIAAGALMTTKGIEGGVELFDVKFVRPFDLQAGCKMVSNHHFGGGMEFFSESSEDSELTVASIGEINAGLSAPSSTKLLSDLKDSHTQEVANIQDRYARLAEAGYHRGAFQSIKSVFLSEDGKSALGRIGLPVDFEHDHDAYYHAHPAVLDGAFS